MEIGKCQNAIMSCEETFCTYLNNLIKSSFWVCHDDSRELQPSQLHGTASHKLYLKKKIAKENYDKFA
jgi:hypothetical protein